MKIPVWHIKSASKKGRFCCPRCHCCRYRKHGFYIRKGFHAPNGAVAIPVKIQRYICLNPQCCRCTFSILPPLALRYCRFFWPHLLAVNRSLCAGVSRYHLARYIWHVGRAVIVRAAATLTRLNVWLSTRYRELSDGRATRGLERMVRFLVATIGRFELVNQWYRHRYPLRFHRQNWLTQNSV